MKFNKQNVVSLIPEGEIPVNSKISDESSIQEDEDEIQIKSEDFHRIYNGVMKKIVDFLLYNRTNIRSFFKTIIYNHKLSDSLIVEAIKMQYFLRELKKVDINVDTIAMYCLFEKLKFSDHIESIDVKKLIEESKIFGLIENNTKYDDNQYIEEFFFCIGKFLKEKNLKLLEFLDGKATKVDIDKEKKDCISNLDFTQLLIDNNIITDFNLIQNIFKSFTADNELIIIEKFKSSLEYYYKKANKNKDKYEIKEISQKQGNINPQNSNNIQNSELKLLCDSLKVEKKCDDDKIKLMQIEKPNEFKKYDDEMDFIPELSHEDTSRSKNLLKKENSAKKAYSNIKNEI